MLTTLHGSHPLTQGANLYRDCTLCPCCYKELLTSVANEVRQTLSDQFNDVNKDTHYVHSFSFCHETSPKVMIFISALVVFVCRRHRFWRADSSIHVCAWAKAFRVSSTQSLLQRSHVMSVCDIRIMFRRWILQMWSCAILSHATSHRQFSANDRITAGGYRTRLHIYLIEMLMCRIDTDTYADTNNIGSVFFV